MDKQQLKYRIALTLLSGVGPVSAKSLIAYCGSCQSVFEKSLKELFKVPGIGPKLATSIMATKSEVLRRAEEECDFVVKNKIKPIFFFDKAYPHRLKSCADAPVLLYFKGNVDFNVAKVISIVGTRRATDYGKDLCDKLVKGFSKYNDILVLSGLAYGIDYAAHRACLKYQVPTVGVLAHGLDRIYPPAHFNTAQRMMADGGTLTEFVSQSRPDRENFPQRNRIVAGMSDATIIVETAQKGGSMITAQLAHAYNRDVFAFPGQVGDKYSKGCNYLIKRHIAGLIEGVEDLATALNWNEEEAKDISTQKELFVELSEEERKLAKFLREKAKTMYIDEICRKLKWTNSTVAATLLTLEFKGLVKAMPGQMYKLK
ncbi:MAG: DNA-processing protein DprA [Chitinophagales bacterium]